MRVMRFVLVQHRLGRYTWRLIDWSLPALSAQLAALWRFINFVLFFFLLLLLIYYYILLYLAILS